MRQNFDANILSLNISAEVLLKMYLLLCGQSACDIPNEEDSEIQRGEVFCPVFFNW